MRRSLFDLHCDTPFEMLRQKQPFGENLLAVSLQKAQGFHHYVQVMAFWCDKTLTDENGWIQFEAMYQNLLCDPVFETNRAKIATSYPEETSDKATFLLAVEDLRILAGELSRVDLLAQKGIRIITPLWANDSCIGGAHNTENGLTEFGKAALDRALQFGILLDISHASIQSADDIFALCNAKKRPVLATHSNAYEVCPVSRNLRNDQIREIIRSDGLIGLNLYKHFIAINKEDVTLDDLCCHIEHFLSLGAANHLALGTDFDGCEPLSSIPDLSALYKLADQLLSLNYSESLVQKMFFANADAFAKKYFIL